MKLTSIFILAACLQVNAAANAQKVTISGKNIPLQKVFKEIRKQAGYNFIYSNEMMQKASLVSLDMKNAGVREVLNSCFANQPFTYTIDEKIIIVKPRYNLIVASAPVIDKIVRGRVTDETGNPLEGVSIRLKGTQTGTATDSHGNYSLILPDDEGTLEFSYVGYSMKAVPVSGRSEINLSLEASFSDMDEMVVVGYGVQKKVNLTGAVSVVGPPEIAERPVSNLEQALQGMVPGLNIQAGSNSGQPGEGNSVNIRGLASLANETGTASFTLGSPFVLVDGVPMEINDIDPNNVESISVLKDAASTAIYGARAAYGVILITTKTGSGKKGKVNLSYSYNHALSQPVSFPDQVDALQYATIINEAAANAGTPQPYTDVVIERIKQYMADPASIDPMFPNSTGTNWDYTDMGIGANANTDWYAELFKKNSTRETHNINISGSGQNIDYALSAGLYNEGGTMRYGHEFYKRHTFGGKIDAKVTDWLKVGLLTNYVSRKDEYPWDAGFDQRNRAMILASSFKPTMPVRDPLMGELINSISGLIAQRENRNTTKWVLSPTVKVEFIKNWVTTLQYNYTSTRYDQTNTAKTYFGYNPDSTKSGPLGQHQTIYKASMNESIYESPNLVSSYFKQIGGHYIGGLVGFQQELWKTFGIAGNSTYLLTDNVPSLGTAVGVKTVGDTKGHWSTQGYFARLNYNYKEKYLLEANVRRDGSSKFEDGSRWGSFPSVSAGYNIAKENFFPFKKQISMFKVRASYGSIGNQNVANYLYIPIMRTGLGNYMLEPDRVNVVLPPNETTIDLTWEKVSTFDLGLDLYMFDNRLSLVADWYRSDITALVGPGMVVPEMYGAAVPKKNEGSLRTTGWEAQIGWKQSIGNFSYFANLNIWDNQSVVTNYNNTLNLLNTFYNGQEIGEIWGYATEGLFESEEEVAKREIDQKYVFNGVFNPGDIKYADLNGDGIINKGKNTADDPGDLKVIGNSSSRYLFGLNAGANWKGFDFTISLQGVGKKDVVPVADFWGATNGVSDATILEGMQDYWREDNKDAYFPKPYFSSNNNMRMKNRQTSDRYLQDGSYVRLKRMQLGYNMPASIVRKIRAERLRIYLTGENLFVKSNDMFFDPESRGISTYPLSKVFSVGCNVTF